jgi:hypothetical protein
MAITDYENAKAVAKWCNEHPESSWDEWAAVATSHGMIQFTEYSDDTFFRNRSWVVCRWVNKIDIDTIEHYDLSNF